MEISSEREYEVTREKLRMLEEQCAASRGDTSSPPHVKELSVRSLARWINRLKEQIARYESRVHGTVTTPVVTPVLPSGTEQRSM